jgi:MFS family permease
LLATQVVGVGATEVGILFTIQGLVVVILGIPLGMLADRKGKRLFMILGLLASAAGLTGIAFAQSYSWLIAFIIIRSLGMPLFNPAAVALLSDSVPPQRQSTIMGLYGTSEIAGSIAGSAIGGFIWSAWGPPATFLIGTGGAVLGTIMCLSLPRGKPGSQ